MTKMCFVVNFPKQYLDSISDLINFSILFILFLLYSFLMAKRYILKNSFCITSLFLPLFIMSLIFKEWKLNFKKLRERSSLVVVSLYNSWLILKISYYFAITFYVSQLRYILSKLLHSLLKTSEIIWKLLFSIYCIIFNLGVFDTIIILKFLKCRMFC